MDFVNTVVLPALILLLVGATSWLAIKATGLVPVAHAWLVAHVGSEHYEMARKLAEDAVRYAESEGLKKQAEDVIIDKRNIALNWLNQALVQRGVSLDVYKLYGFIESAWLTNFGWEKLDKAKPAVAASTHEAPSGEVAAP